MADVLRVVVNTDVLDRLEREMPGKADKALGKFAMTVEGKAKQLMQGGRSGRTYRVPGTSGATYTASAPGEPPAVVTGNLKNSIQSKRMGTLRWAVLVGTEYAEYLEFGHASRNGGRVSPRPFLRPAIWSVVNHFPDEMIKVILP